MRSPIVTLAIALAACGIVYGCSGESTTLSPTKSSHAGTAGHFTTGEAGAPNGAGGKGGTGGTSGRSTSAGRGGAMGSGASGGTAPGKGGSGGGSSGRGGAGKDGPGGAGSGSGGTLTVCEDEAPSYGGGGQTEGEYEWVDACCRGEVPWGSSPHYYASDVEACGEPRTCEAQISTLDCHQDYRHAYVFDTRCCADGRWHLIKGEQQIIDRSNRFLPYFLPSALSPACGGQTWPSERGLHFDGESHLELPTQGNILFGAWELWFRTTQASGPLLSTDEQGAAFYLSEGRVCFYPNLDPLGLCTEENTFADGSWHHAAVSAGRVFDEHDHQNVRGGIYVDGKLRVTSEPIDLGVSTTVFAGYGRIGLILPPIHFVGDLDEIRIWRDFRDQIQILDYYATRLVDDDSRSELVGYYPLEEGGSATTMLENLSGPERWSQDSQCDRNDGQVGEGGAGGAGELRGEMVGFEAGVDWVEPGGF